ncbi:PEP-CTERM domain protein [Hahella ganghwensis]|uniref:PEP-CTERM domain protein n=1 Tax=Hahella ganghwensis TaxID=286420 RepID=UPI00037BAED8|nr:PEP-CTERM domain protein [Hahella ganghwensis]
MRNFFGAIGIACLSLNASAALITDTYETTLDWVGFDSSVLDPSDFPDSHSLDGQRFVWTVTYDNEATSAHQYMPGVNGVDELGKGDDDILSEMGMDRFQDLAFISDAVFDLSSFASILTEFAYQNNLTRDNSISLSGLDSFYAGFESGEFTAVRTSDWMHFNVAGIGSTIWAGASFEEGDLDIWASNTLVSSTLSVPSPTALSLLGIGLAGLVCLKRKSRGA